MWPGGGPTPKIFTSWAHLTLNFNLSKKKIQLSGIWTKDLYATILDHIVQNQEVIRKAGWPEAEDGPDSKTASRGRPAVNFRSFHRGDPMKIFLKFFWKKKPIFVQKPFFLDGQQSVMSPGHGLWSPWRKNRFTLFQSWFHHVFIHFLPTFDPVLFPGFILLSSPFHPRLIPCLSCFSGIVIHNSCCLLTNQRLNKHFGRYADRRLEWVKAA